jgi:uncharacterized protein YdhG (YjbR/CyaY superfamily)
VTALPERPCYRVRVEIPRISGTRGWRAAATAFEQGLAAQDSLLVTDRQIELVTRQRRDYVRISVTVEAVHVAEAAVVAWAVLQQAVGEDSAGWDMAAASAEIQPVKSARLPTTPADATRPWRRAGLSLPMRLGGQQDGVMSAQEIDRYLDGLEEPKRSTLARLRQTILDLLPEADQGISYGVPAFKVDGKTIAGFAAFKHHLSYLPHSGSVFPQLSEELRGYSTSTGALRFGVDEPLPVPLVQKLITVRLRQAFPPEGPHPTPPRAASPETADLAGRVRAICLPLPEVTERLSHGAPTWFVRDKSAFVTLWARGHHDHDFPHLWCAGPPGAQQELVAAEPDRFFRPRRPRPRSKARCGPAAASATRRGSRTAVSAWPA